MKLLGIILLLTAISLDLWGQRQLDIQGNASSADTVATIIVNSITASDIVGLSVRSIPQNGMGIAGKFFGGHLAIIGESISGTGVNGESHSGNGVYGNSMSGVGVYGNSQTGQGGSFFGGEYGVQGTSSLGEGGHFIGGEKGVNAISPSGTGVYGESYEGIGILGKSTTGTGIYGESFAGYLGKGIHGFCINGSGVYGHSTNGQGIHGFSEAGVGVYGVSYSESIWGKGVYGDCSHGPGVFGSSDTGEGIYGTSDSGKGGFFYGGSGVAIELGGADSEWGQESDDCVIRADSSDTGSDLIMVANDVISFHLDDDNDSNSSMLVYNGSNTAILTLDESGNLNLTGTCNCSSDVNRKENFSSIDARKLLEKVAALPISEWQFIGETTRHIGPMAQDFHSTFGFGSNPTSIATVDANGIALAAIQALKKENDELKQRIELLEERISRIIK